MSYSLKASEFDEANSIRNNFRDTLEEVFEITRQEYDAEIKRIKQKFVSKGDKRHDHEIQKVSAEFSRKIEKLNKYLIVIKRMSIEKIYRDRDYLRRLIASKFKEDVKEEHKYANVARLGLLSLIVIATIWAVSRQQHQQVDTIIVVAFVIVMAAIIGFLMINKERKLVPSYT